MEEGKRSFVFASVLCLALAGCGGGGTSEGDNSSGAPVPANKSVTLSWTKPATNTDGTDLTDLSGYSVFHGTASRLYFTPVQISDPEVTSAVIEGLSSGRWYFAIKSINEAGMESDFSGEVYADL